MGHPKNLRSINLYMLTVRFILNVVWIFPEINIAVLDPEEPHWANIHSHIMNY